MNIAKFNERHQKMLDYQRNVKPIAPMRDLEEVFGLSSTSAVDYVLKKMAGCGMVKRVPKGKYSQYVAVDIVEVKDE